MSARTTPTALVARPVQFGDIPRSCWERLLAATPAATPFARWTFHRAWWEAYGAGAEESYLACVPADERADRVDWEVARAIIPLMHRREATQEAVLFGASYHADYATILSAEADIAAAAAATARALDGLPDTDGHQPWDVVDLRRLRADDPALPALQNAFATTDSGWKVRREQEDVCPVITAASGDWDEYLATLDKKDRHEIRRKVRRASAVGELRIDISAPTAEAINSFVELHNLRFGERGLFPPGFDGDQSRHFVDRLAKLERESPGGGQLHVGLVHCGSRLVWAMLAFDDGQTCFLYNAGMDPDARNVSPGITGTAEYLMNRLAAGRRRFDFLRGDEPYKYEWAARDEPIERLLVTREAPR